MWLFESSCVICDAAANGVCEVCVDKLVTAEVPPLLAIDEATALFSYEGAGAELLRSLKFKNRRHVLGPLVDALATSVSRDIDVIVPVPGHPERVRGRGVDLPAVMARRLSRCLGVPVAEPLLRVDGGSQTGRGRTERQGVEFRATRRVPDRVLLVDDVVTTGATAVACAEALSVAGARTTKFVAIASTPSVLDLRVKATCSSVEGHNRR
jgi:predicted amidophosphoribosyltransferase